MATPLSYTLVLDGASRPDPSHPDFSLSLNPNPVFTHVLQSDIRRTYRSKDPIRIVV